MLRALRSGINCTQKRMGSHFSGSLISDPFKFDNTRKIRDTNSRFPKPNFISFDAFGTLYIPKLPVHEQYYSIAKNEFGIDKSAESIKQAFPVVHNRLLEEYPNYGKNSSTITTIDDWWLELIVNLFDIPHFNHDSQSRTLCQRLVNHFQSSEAYHLYDDVIPTLAELQERRIPIIVSSNSDARIYDILQSLGVMKYIDKENIFISYNVNHEKPNKSFFDIVSTKVMTKQIDTTTTPISREERARFLENCWHVGDGHEKDYIGAVKAGWNGIFLDRQVKSPYLTQEIPDPEEDSPSCITKPPNDSTAEALQPAQIIANNRAILSSLHQLLDLFKK